MIIEQPECNGSHDLNFRFAWMSSVCAMLVVYIHIPMYHAFVGINRVFYDLLRSGLCQIAVPFFFFASGFFLAKHYAEKSWYEDAIRKRCKTILVPYIIFSCLYLLFKYFCAFVHSKVLNSDFLFSVPWMKVFGLNLLDFPQLGLLWYLRTLMTLVLLSCILLRLARSTVFICLLFLVHGIVNPFGGVPPLRTGCLQFLFTFGPLSVIGIFYFCLGAWFRLNPKAKNILCFGTLALILGIAALVVKTILHTYVCDFQAAYIGWMMVPFLIIGFMSLRCFDCAPPKLISRAFPLYLCHFFVVDSLFLVIVACKGQHLLDMMSVFVLIGICIILITFIMIHYLYKHFPHLSSLIFGGR